MNSKDDDSTTQEKNGMVNRKRPASPGDTPSSAPKSKRGRPRKQINYSVLDAGSSTVFMEDKVEFEPRKKTTSKESDTEMTNNNSPDKSYGENDDDVNGDPKKGSRHTGYTGKMIDTLLDFIGTSDKTKDDQKQLVQQTEVVKNEEPSFSSGITCAVCKSRMEKTTWAFHKQRYHNNLAWREGEPPLDLSDKGFIMATLNALYKKKKPLYCECGVAKKSVVGFLSHQSTCRKPDEQRDSCKVACDICGKKVLPVSLRTHMKFVHSKSKEESSDKTVKKETKAAVLSERRTAAKKAMQVISTNLSGSSFDSHFTTNMDLTSQEFVTEVLSGQIEEKGTVNCVFECVFSASNISEVKAHISECDKKPLKGFICKHCLEFKAEVSQMLEHLQSFHDVFLELDDHEPEYIYEKGLEKEATERQSTRLPRFIYSDRISKKALWYKPAVKWTQEFQDKNYSDLLFPHLTASSLADSILPIQVSLVYLPKLDESCHFCCKPSTSFIIPPDDDYEWQKCPLFESVSHPDGKVSIFCGGPVASMAWLPTPRKSNNTDQILAVSVLNHPDDQYKTTQSYGESTAIQFWNFGTLSNSCGLSTTPKLALNLCHDHGPIWHMEWCPSGCYNDNRAGLLATTGSDTLVYIYAIPLFTTNMRGLCYKPKPVCKLFSQRPGANFLGGVPYFPTKISWSKFTGHNFIAVGYSNGSVALFNLQLQSPLVKYVDMDNVISYLPIKHFHAHSHSITSLSLSPLGGGGRWLLTGSMDRMVNLWDLNDCAYPVDTLKKNIVTDVVWPIHWLNYTSSSDEASSSAYLVNCMSRSIHDYWSDKQFGMTCSSATVSALTYSEWHNAYLHSSTMGEVIAILPHQLFHINEKSVLRRRRMLFGHCHAIDKSQTPEERNAAQELRLKTLQNLVKRDSEASSNSSTKLCQITSEVDQDEEPITYQEAVNKYGVVFYDNPMESEMDFPANTASQLTSHSKYFGISKPDQYPINAINTAVFNPNKQASLLYACGYQAGFVRLSFMKFVQE